MAFRAMKRTKVKNAAETNPYQQATMTSPFKMPSVRCITGSPQTKATSTLPAEAPVVLAITKYTDNASVFGREFHGTPLYQVQMTHECSPSVFKSFIASLQQFLQDAHTADENFPENLAELREQGIVAQITNAEDPFRVGFQQWRIAMYTDREIMNLLSFIQDFIGYKISQDKKLKNIEIQLSGLPTFEKPESWTLNVKVEEVVPFSPFAAWPPYGTKVVLATIEVDETASVCGMLFGNTYAFKDKLEAHGMFGTSMPINGKSEYVRLFGEVDTNNNERVAWLILGLTQLIDNTVVQLRVSYKEQISIHTAVQDFLKRLQDVPTIFVVT